MSPKDSDFDWVTARRECSIAHEFIQLQRLAEQNVAERQKDLGKSLLLQTDPPFAICRQAYGLKSWSWVVTFFIVGNEIHVRNHDGSVKSTLTLTLNDAGECRYRIDGKGEFVRWQVLRRFLEPLLF